MNRRALGTWGVVMLLVLGAAGVLYFAEWVETTTNDGYTADALRSRYLAAERFLDRFDITIASRDGLNLLDELPPTSHTLLIASSRPGTEAANLQGIWNDMANPWWDSKYTVNINLPMNYWLAESTNLSELTEPLTRLIREVSESGTSVAR